VRHSKEGNCLHHFFLEQERNEFQEEMRKTIAFLAMAHYVATFGGGRSLPLLSRLAEHGRRDSRGSIVCNH
jgi:hypothetical protein